ncbi:MAG: secondary thiamine-phosphate synthase enzyme YjbQ [Candidatus Pacebacteria bacterium]|nr:secondary thiamine-phosphate synthase enzyme YjbQ [Candidatus Paceibacterota bacterium]
MFDGFAGPSAVSENLSGGLNVQLPVKTSKHAEFVDITSDVRDTVPAGFSGICMVFCMHTTAGLTINENADPSVVSDLLSELERLVPWRNPEFRHMEGNSAAHVKSSLLGQSVTVPVEDGHLVLGTWQGIYFCEFDGPRSRRVTVQLVGGLVKV